MFGYYFRFVFSVPVLVLGVKFQAPQTDSRSGGVSNLVDNWYSPSCINFYTKVSPARDAIRGNMPQRSALEDSCRGARFGSVVPHKMANEIVLVPELKIAYVINLKTSSTTIRSMLDHFWGRNYQTCGLSKVPANCTVYYTRCGSLCLQDAQVDAQIEDYFFFSFVRDPVERFYSSLVQASMNQLRNNMTRDEAVQYLQNLRDGTCGVDQHLESQTRALSTPWYVSGEKILEVPLDFVGRAEHLADDMVSMLELAHARLGQRMPDELAQDVKAFLNQTHGKTAKSFFKDGITAFRDSELDELVRRTYAQDMKCFQY